MNQEWSDVVSGVTFNLAELSTFNLAKPYI